PLERFAPEEKIVAEGNKGETMYLILAGRALVYVTKPSGERINVASLAPGDFFGENSFFSGARRNATVEAVENTSVIEIGQLLYDRVMRGNPKASSILLRFYKERIVDRLLATSPTFGLLSAAERKEVLAKLALGAFDDGTEIVKKGERHTAV